MKPSEARVFIIEDDSQKLKRLTGFVEANGGRVVGSVNTREDAYRVVCDEDFPASVGNANTVLIDGNLDKHGRRGTDGKYIFLKGYERGVLRRVDTKKDAIGAVALGCSVDGRSDVVYATGGNINRLYDEEAATRWAEMLEPHPAEPFYLGVGAIERKDWSSGLRFGEMMEHVIKADGNPTLNVLSLMVNETEKDGEEEMVTYTDEVTSPTEMSYEDFINKAGKWQGVEDGYIKVDTHSTRAVVQAGDHLYVISHSSEVVKSTWGSDLYHRGKTDKISLASLAEVPDTYWQSHGIERPIL